MNSYSRIVLILLGAGVYLLPWVLIFGRLAGTPLGIDFGMLRTATLAALHLRDPYSAGPGFYNLPWMLLFVAPFSFLPKALGFLLWTVAGLGAYATAFRRMGMGWPTVFLLVFSPLAVGNLMFGNYDWLILLAATLPAAWGIWVMPLKPQLGWVVAVYWVWQSLKAGLRRLLIVVLPVAAAILIAFALGYRLPEDSQMQWSADAWPWGIPVGLGLAYFAFRRRDPLLALAAAPFLSPYVVWHSWIAVLLPLSRRPWALFAGILASWVFFWWVFTR